jgi:uncharacterized protein (TIGR01777 family)
MRYIITGGTGLVGTALAKDLLADGHEVVVLSRTPDSPRGLPEEVQVVGWDARTAEGWGHLAEGAEAILNLAGANLAGEGFIPSRWTDERKRIIRESRINSGRAVLAAVEQARQKPRLVVQASGVGYYGFRGDEPVTEEGEAGDDFLGHLAAEEWEPSTAPVEEMGVRRVIIRSGAVLTPEEGALPRLVLPFRLFVGGTLGRGDQWHSWIHLRDEIRAIRFLLRHEEASGPFNLTAPQPVTNAEFGRVLGRVMNRPAWLPVPEFALRLAVGQVSDVLLEGQRAVPRRLLELGFSFRFPELEEALRELLK